jgi:hypothetical protein
MVGWAFHPSETARANTENARDRIESGSSTGALAGLVAEDSTTFPSCRVLYSDRSTRRINRGRETMRDDPWTAANRDKEQLKVTIRPTRKQTAETASPPSYTDLLKGDGIPVLLSLEFDAGPRGGAEAAARRSRGSCSRLDERIHVHWLYARHTSVLYESKSRSPRRFHRISLPRWICWLRSLLVPAATAALFTPTTRPSAFHSWSRSIGRTRERWPAGNHRRRTDILARMEPGKGRL